MILLLFSHQCLSFIVRLCAYVYIHYYHVIIAFCHVYMKSPPGPTQNILCITRKRIILPETCPHIFFIFEILEICFVKQRYTNLKSVAVFTPGHGYSLKNLFYSRHRNVYINFISIIIIIIIIIITTIIIISWDHDYDISTDGLQEVDSTLASEQSCLNHIYLFILFYFILHYFLFL